MFIIRPAQEGDVDGLVSLASKASGGLTTLPANKKIMSERVNLSLKSFANTKNTLGEQYYFFVAEDIKAKKIVGTSAIFACVGKDIPFYNYKLLQLMQVSKSPAVKVRTQLLSLSNDYTGASELATLYLDPDYRSAGVGRVLSKCRYLLMASYPKKFSELIMAEVRGWTDESGQSPFWNAVGKHFFNMEFAEADRINGLGNNQFIGDLMPKFPIYTNLLPESARSVIGKPHVRSDAALKLLEEEGFKFRGAVDIFDAGPIVEAHIENIKSIKNAKRTIISTTKEKIMGTEVMVANPILDKFIVIRTPIIIDDESGRKITISEKAAQTLDLQQGMEAIFLPLERG